MESTRDERADARGSSCEDVDGGLMYPPAAREAKVTTVTCPARTGSAVNIVCGDPGANARPGPATLLSLSDVELVMTLGFLDSSTLARCQLTCRTLGAAATNDDLWKAACLENWGETRRVLPERRDQDVTTYHEAWKGWRRSFNGYKASDVKRVASWWAAIEAWTSEHIPEMTRSLNRGVSEEDLDEAEMVLGWTMPVHLRLLYRFHDGQSPPSDEYLYDAHYRTEAQGVGSSSSTQRFGKMAGLFGQCALPCGGDGVNISLLRRAVEWSRLSFDSSCFAAQYRPCRQDSTMTSGVDDDSTMKAGFLLGSDSRTNKTVFVGSKGNVRLRHLHPASSSSMGAAPLVATPSSENAAQDRPAGNLMPWLEEYLRRLQEGYYGLRYSTKGISYSLAYLRADRVMKTRGISLFPQQTKSCVLEITKGVKIQVSVTFAPEGSRHPNKCTWAYSVHMELLRDHPSRPKGMTSCQLSTRTWIIDNSQGIRREIAGEGVIGLYPVLSLSPTGGSHIGSASTVEDDAAHGYGVALGSFRYESAVELGNLPGTMRGHYSFTPGSRSSPTGPSFDVSIPVFNLVKPAYIY